jgi:hypothetical protein
MFKLKSSFIFIGAFLGFIACTKAPEYPKEPIIKYNSFTKFTNFSGNTGGTQLQDSIIISVDFTDGDGDLGLSVEDLAQEPYKGNFNYFIDIYIKEGEDFVLKEFENITYNGNFPPLIDRGYKGPLEGTLRRAINLSHPNFAPNTKVKFQIRILDRALNESNTITTPEITIREQ